MTANDVMMIAGSVVMVLTGNEVVVVVTGGVVMVIKDNAIAMTRNVLIMKNVKQTVRKDSHERDRE